MRYKQNLYTADSKVYSYNTIVGKIDHKNRTIKEVKWWDKIKRLDLNGNRFTKQSPTTSRHLHYVAREINYELIRNK